MSGPYAPPPAAPPTYPMYPPASPSYPSPYPYPYPYYGLPVARRPFPLAPRQIAALILGLVGLVLTAAALLSGWWSLSASAGGTGISATVTLTYGLFGPGSSGFGVTILPSDPPVANVFTVTALMVCVAVLLAIFPVVLGFLAARPWARWTGVGLAAASGVLSIVAPFYIMAALPGPLWSSLGSGTFLPGGTYSGFWGATAIGFGGIVMQLSWGAGLGWYLSFAGGAVTLAGGALLAIPPRAPVPYVLPANPASAEAAPSDSGASPSQGAPEAPATGPALSPPPSS